MPEEMDQKEEANSKENAGSSNEENSKKESSASNTKGIVSQLEAILDEYMVKKAPFTIPMNGKEMIVKIAPYVVIVFAIMSVPVLLAGLGLSAMLAPFAMLGGYHSVAAFISIAFAIVSLVINVMAVPGLFAREKKGWRLAFYSSIVSFVGNILTFNIAGGVIGALIGWYILFQVKELYKK
jgi:hypothetical protein